MDKNNNNNPTKDDEEHNSIHKGIFLVQIGQVENNRPAVFGLGFTNIFVLSGDNKALNYLSSSVPCKGIKCRCCTNEKNMKPLP